MAVCGLYNFFVNRFFIFLFNCLANMNSSGMNTSIISLSVCHLSLFNKLFLKFFCFFYSRHPEVKWAEREDKVFLTVLLPDAKNPKVNLDPEGVFSFSGTAGAENHHYELKLQLHDKVNVEVRTSCTPQLVSAGLYF